MSHSLKTNENLKRERSYKANNEFVRRIANRWFATENKARKHSEMANGSGMVEGNRMSQQHHMDNRNDGSVGNYETNASKTSQTPHLIADYGILGISDDEDSAKWASDEMKKATANKERISEEILSTDNTRNASPMANMSKQTSMKDSSKDMGTSVKIAPANSTEKTVAKVNDLQPSNGNITGRGNRTDLLFQVTNLPEKIKPGILFQNATSADGSKLNNITAKGKRPGSLIHNTTLANVQQLLKSNTTVNHTAEQLNTAPEIKIIKYNESISNTAVHRTASEAVQNNAPRNSTSESKLKTDDNQTVSTSPLPQKSQTHLSEQFSAQAEAPSLEINVTSLRKGQSFDLQIPNSIPSKGSYQDNHFHFEPKETLSSSEYSPEDLEKNSNNSFFLNATLKKVNAEMQEKRMQPDKFLQRLNSDILASRAEPLTNNENLGSEVTDETFREESPAGRTFAENLLEPNTNEALLNRRPSSVQGQERQTEIQQDESLARALNSSSVSSIIFSANRAIFDTDKEVFSKKSAQGRLNSTKKEQRNKRSDLLQHLKKNRINSLASKLHSPRKTYTSGKHVKNHRDVTARQVINLGNHFLWFGGQSSADANGFPRHNTATASTPYNINGYISNFLNAANGNEAASTTKGYKALQNALTSMESNQYGQSNPSISDSMFALPSGKEWQDSDQGQSPASVVIQDNTGKPVYQGVVDILKLNSTTSNNSVNSESGRQNNKVLIGEKDEASNKENESAHNQTQQDSLSHANNSSQTSNSGISDSSNPIFALQNSSNDGNQTVNQNSEGSTSHVDDRNTTLPGKGSSDQKHIQEIQGIKQTEQMQSDVQLSNQTQEKVSPSAIIKKISTNSQEPETYHVIVNDAGKKITNANGHVTVIISGPTATQASMPNENTLLIPQTSPSSLSPEHDYVSYDENAHSGTSENSDQDFSTQSQNITSKDLNFLSQQTSNNSSLRVNKTNVMNANQKAALSLLQQELVPALKISDGIEGQLRKGEADEERPLKDKTQDQSEQASGAHATENEHKNTQNNESESLMQNGHNFVHVGQDLAGSIDGLQMEEVSRPNVQPEQQREQENLLEGPAGEFIEGGDPYAGPMQPQEVPTLNIVLNPTQRIHGSLSVDGKVIPITSARDRDSQAQQQLDCHADPKNEKTSSTVLTCQKKHSLGIFQSFGKQSSPPTAGDLYDGNPRMTGSPALQLDQVMNVLNDQVKTTINKEMKTESKDIENVLSGMTVPSSTLMDTEEAYSQSEPPQRSSLMDTDETFTSSPDFERRGKRRRPYHRKVHQFEFPYHLGFPQLIGFARHHGFPHRRHFLRYNHHSNPFVVMAHKDSDDGFWDYQHNIFIPRDFSHEDDNDEEEEDRDKHWTSWGHHGHRRGNWIMAHPPMQPFHPHFSPFREPDLVHLRLPTIFGRSGPWRPYHQIIKTTPQVHKQEQGAKRTAVVHKALRGDRDMCRPIIEGPSPPLKGEWEYLGKVLSSCPCRLTDSEW